MFANGWCNTRDFNHNHNPGKGTCVCPAGKKRYRDGSGCTINGYAAVKFQGAQRDCVPCTHRERCLLTPQETKTRQVAFFHGKADPESYTDKMKQRIDSQEGRARYGRRFATVVPVFGNLRCNKGLDRFTLRGRKKVDAQWKRFCRVQNIEKLAHHGYAIYKEEKRLSNAGSGQNFMQICMGVTFDKKRVAK